MKTSYAIILSIIINMLVNAGCDHEYSITYIPAETYIGGRMHYNTQVYDSTYSYWRYFYVTNYKNSEECNEFIKKYLLSLEIDTCCAVNQFVVFESDRKFLEILKNEEFNSMADIRIAKFQRITMTYFVGDQTATIHYETNFKITRSERVYLNAK